MMNLFCQGFQENVLGKDKYFQHMVLGQMDIHEQMNEMGSLLHIIHKMNSKEIIDLNVRTKL